MGETEVLRLTGVANVRLNSSVIAWFLELQFAHDSQHVSYFRATLWLNKIISGQALES